MSAEADARGPLARSLVDDLLALAPDERRPIYREFSAREMQVVLTGCRRELGSRYALWRDDPVGFVQDVSGDTTWSLQERLLLSVRDYQRTVVPSTHSASKTFTGGRIVAWWVAVHPLGMAQAVTTAPTFRQVKNQMWPGIAAAHAAAALPGEVQQAQWKVGRHVCAYGFTVGEHNEAALQGIKANDLLIVVDEAGGIGHTLGRAFTSLLSQPNVRMVVLGNPPTDEEGTWFEEQSEKMGDLVSTVRIAAGSTPNFTGEQTGRCTTCPAIVPPHRIAMHLTQHEWVESVVQEFGDESNYVTARVHAQFPRAVGQKVMPFEWVEAAASADHEPRAGTWVRLGADIASEGGDEFVIARLVGFRAEIVHRSSGAANADPVNVAGKIFDAVREAVDVRERVGDDRRVHVKIDASGLGWGVAGLVKRWAAEHGLPVNVYGVRGEDKPHDEQRFKNARSEIWWNMRRLVQPATDPISGQVLAPGAVHFVNAPERLLAQLSAPKYATDSSGRTVVEQKKDTKKRVGGSPDLADAVNLAAYEPAGQGEGRIERASTSMPVGPQQRGGVTSFDRGGLAPVVPIGPPKRT